MNRKISIGTTVCLMVISMCAAVLITMLILVFSGLLVTGNATGWYDKISEIDRITTDNYYGEIDMEMLTDSIADGYMYGLGDPYADYYNGEITEETQLSNRGSMQGIGITVIYNETADAMYVYRVDPRGPSAAAGVQVGDLITGVDGLTVAEDGYEAVTEGIGGEVGTFCYLQIRRGNETLELPVERLQHEITTVYSRMVADVGYISIERFNDLTDDQIIAAIEELLASGATSLVFDVRGCSGGLVDPTADILDYLLPEGKIISATYVSGDTKVLHSSDAKELDMPMAVLTNGSTASAAELFAAAIRDYEKGITVGETTFGKGIMQHTYNLSDGSSVKMTVAEFLPPSGECFHGIGVQPDIEVTLTEEEWAHFYFMTDEEDRQLQAAIDYLHTEQ